MFEPKRAPQNATAAAAPPCRWFRDVSASKLKCERSGRRFHRFRHLHLRRPPLLHPVQAIDDANKIALKIVLRMGRPSRWVAV